MLECLSSQNGRNVNYFQPCVSSNNYLTFCSIVIASLTSLISLHACAGQCLAEDCNETSARIPSLEYAALEILAALTPLHSLPHTHMPIFISSFQQDLQNLFMFLLSVFQSGNHHCTVGWRDCGAHLICFLWCRDQIVCCPLSNIWKLFNGVCYSCYN